MNDAFRLYLLTGAAALALGISAPASAATVTNLDNSTGPAALAAAPVNVGFSEEIGNSRTTTTAGVHSIDRGIDPFTIFTVDKLIHNISTSDHWIDFHIQLQVLNNGQWVNSTDADGVSFADIESDAAFKASAAVDLNNTLQSGWSLVRDTTHDTLDYKFNTFAVDPNDTLSLHFDMSDNQPNDNTWRLVQIASVPEASTWAMMILGFAGVGFMASRRKAKPLLMTT